MGESVFVAVNVRNYFWRYIIRMVVVERIGLGKVVILIKCIVGFQRIIILRDMSYYALIATLERIELWREYVHTN
jgi:hypothetical protein